MTMAQPQDDGAEGACQKPPNCLASSATKSRSSSSTTSRLYESFKKTWNSQKFKESLEYFSKSKSAGETRVNQDKMTRSGSLGRGQWRVDQHSHKPLASTAQVPKPVASFCTLPRSVQGGEEEQSQPELPVPAPHPEPKKVITDASAELSTAAFRLDMGYRSVSVSSLRRVFESSSSAKQESGKSRFRWSLTNGVVLNSVGSSLAVAPEEPQPEPLPCGDNPAKKSFLDGMLQPNTEHVKAEVRSSSSASSSKKTDLEEPKISVSITGGGPSQPLRANFKILVQRTPSARRKATVPSFPASRQRLRRHASGIGRRRGAGTVVSSDGSVDGEGAGDVTIREGTGVRRRVSSRCEGGYNLNFTASASKVARLISKYDNLGGGQAGAPNSTKHDADHQADTTGPAGVESSEVEPERQVPLEPETKPEEDTVKCVPTKANMTFLHSGQSETEPAETCDPPVLPSSHQVHTSAPTPQPRPSLLKPKSSIIYANINGNDVFMDLDAPPPTSLPLVPNASFLWARHMASLPPNLDTDDIYDDIGAPSDTYGYDAIQAPSSYSYIELDNADSMCGYEVVQPPDDVCRRLLPELPFADDDVALEEEPLYAEADEARPPSKEPLYETAGESDAVNHELLHHLGPFSEVSDEWIDCADEEDNFAHPRIRVQLVQRSRSRARRLGRAHNAVRRTWSQKMREAQRRQFRTSPGACDACWEDEVCVCSSSSLYLGDLDSSIYSSNSCRSYSNDSHPDGPAKEYIIAGGPSQTARLRSVHFQGDRDELQELAFFVEEEETDVEDETTGAEEPLYEAIGSEVVQQNTSVSAEDSFDSFDSDNTGEERNPLYHNKALPETPASSNARDSECSKPSSASSGIGRIGQQMLHLGRKISGTNADLSAWGFSSLRRKSSSGLSLLPFSAVDTSPDSVSAQHSPSGPKEASTSDNNARKKRWSFKRFRRKDAAAKDIEARKGSFGNANSCKETSTFYVQIKGERTRHVTDGRSESDSNISMNSSSSGSTPEHPRPTPRGALRTSRSVGPRLGRALSMMRPTSPPPAPPPLRRPSQEPALEGNCTPPWTSGCLPPQEKEDHRMKVADSNGYILTSEISSTLSSDSGGFTSDQLADEPLYQFYTQELLHRDYNEQWSESEDGYEEVGPRETPKPTAMELVHPCPGSRSLWCELPHVMVSGVLDQISAQERKLQEAMFEVIASEASYLKSLRLLQSHFVEAPSLSDDRLLSKQERVMLFGDVAAVRECSERFLADLERRWQERVLLSRVADIIYEHASKYFSAYVKCCSNQVHRDKLLRSLMSSRPGFVEVLRRLEASPCCQSLVLHSFLMLPMQRVTRLPLLVDAVLRRLEPTSPEYPTCQLALAALNKLAQDCNEGARKMERLQELLVLSQQLDFREVSNVALVKGSRWLVRRGEVVRLQWKDADAKLTFGRRVTRHRLHLFLFSDLLVVARKRGEDSYLVIDHCARNMVHVTELDDRERLPSKFPADCRNLMLLTMLQNHDHRTVEMVLACSVESERSRWYEAVTPRSSENPEERVYEEWDCPQVQATHPYTAQQPDELSLHTADVVNVLRKLPDDWYLGERLRDGDRGWFPANHCKEIASAHLRARNLRQRYRLLELSASFLQQQHHQSDKRHSKVFPDVVDKR